MSLMSVTTSSIFSSEPCCMPWYMRNRPISTSTSQLTLPASTWAFTFSIPGPISSMISMPVALENGSE